jgi:hypothetical protein
LAFPIKLEWYKRPYFGVADLVFNARNKAFSAPKIWIVLAGYFAKVDNEPEWDINLAVTVSPTRALVFGAKFCVLSFK